MSAPRIALIGARRTRQGLGPFIARFLVSFGAEIPAVIGHCPETIEGGVQELRERCGIEADGFASLEEACERHELDAAVIASPAGTHRPYLESAVENGLHVLCEKPFLLTGSESVKLTNRLVERFEERGLLLVENVQWPETWPAFLELYPEAGGEVPERFEMWLSPHEGGRAMVVDCYSHPLSLLQRLAPGEDIDVSDIRYSRPDERTLRCELGYRAGLALVEAVITCRTQTEQPKPAAYAVNGLRADRVVEPETYAMSLQGGGRSVPMPDPMERLLKRFFDRLVEAKRGAEVGPDIGIRTRMRIFHQLLDAYDSLQSPNGPPREVTPRGET